MNNLYFDSAATTQVRSEVIEKMQEALSNFMGTHHLLIVLVDLRKVLLNGLEKQ